MRRTKRPGSGRTGNFGFRSSLAAAAASDRRRPQATAGDRRRASASGAKKNEPARLHRTKTPPRLIPATWDFAHERAAEMGGGEWRPSHKAAQRSAGRMTGAMATSRFTPPGATAPTQSNNAARRGAARRWCCTCGWAAQQAALVTPGKSPSRPGRVWWEDSPASSSCTPLALPRSRDH